VKTRLYKHLPISKAVYTIVEQIADLACKYNAEINRNWRSLPRLLDRAAFAVVSNKLTHYALDIVMRKWSATKVLGDNIKEQPKLLNFELGTKCKSACKLLV
jgi:hypothetical protein